MRDERDAGDARRRRRSWPSETRKIAPADARTAFGPVGSAQPAERRMNAGPSASAARSRVPDVSRIRHAPEREPDRRVERPRQVGPAKDRDHPGRVRQRREARHHVRARRSSAPASRSTSAGRSASTRASTGSRPASSPARRRDPRPRRRRARASPADAATRACGQSLTRRVGRGGDHAKPEPRTSGRVHASRSSAALRARSAILVENGLAAARSWTAMSASALRSSSISAFRQPATNWL